MLGQGNYSFSLLRYVIGGWSKLNLPFAKQIGTPLSKFCDSGLLWHL